MEINPILCIYSNFLSPPYLKLSHKTEETWCLFFKLRECVCQRGKIRQAHQKGLRFPDMWVKKNGKRRTVMYQTMCLLSTVIMKNGRVIYPVRQTDGRKGLFLSKSFAWTPSCQILLVPQCAIKLQITALRTIFVSLLRFLPARLQRDL